MLIEGSYLCSGFNRRCFDLTSHIELVEMRVDRSVNEPFNPNRCQIDLSP